MEDELFEGVEEELSSVVEDNMEFEVLEVGGRTDCNASNWIATTSSGLQNVC
jgi:hypothetical protein